MSSRNGLTATVGLALMAFPAWGQKQVGPTVTELATRVEQVAGQLKNAEDNLRVVETQYSEVPEPTDDEARLRRFSDGEIQYLLGNYSNASVLFYDLVSDKRFESHPRHVDALFYLADSLYQQRNYVGAKPYLRQVLQTNSPHQREALTRYIEVAGHLNEFIGIEGYIQAMRSGAGTLPPDVAYVYGKWLQRRTDLPLEERVRRARDVFTPLAEAPTGSFRLQSAYFIGVGYVQLRDYPGALGQFQKVIDAKPLSDRDRQVQELASLSMARVLYEAEDFDAAIDRYQEIPRDSENFVHAMYEVAWVHVKKKEYLKALNATEILGLVAQNSTIEPEVTLLKAHLLLKLGRYQEATDTYNLVINTFAPVRDEIESLLSVHSDPVKYFDELLAKNDRNLEVTALLPPIALKWATTQKEVSDAVQMVSDIESGKKGIKDSEEIAQRILQVLDERGLETFPRLQEGYTRADAVESALGQIEHSLVAIESALVEDRLVGEERARLAKLKAEQAALQARFDTLPKSELEVAERRRRIQGKVDEVDKAAFKLEYEIQSMFAVVTAVEKWLDDTRPHRRNRPEEEKAFLEQMRTEVEALNSLQKEIAQLRQTLAQERASADAALSGEEALRKQFLETLHQQHALIQAVEAKLPMDATEVLSRASQIRARAAVVKTRVQAAKGKIRDQVARQGQQIRDTIRAEQALLAGFSTQTGNVSSDARNLVGRIVVDSFGRVRKQFYDLVLKADVGVVDVAFTRKQDKTAEIQKLSNMKDKEVQALDSEFEEVLKDVD